MENEFKPLSEGTANALAESISSYKNVTETFIETATLTANQLIINAYLRVQLKVAKLELKVKNAYFFTRWYWEIKYKKAKSKLQELENDEEFMAIIKS